MHSSLISICIKPTKSLIVDEHTTEPGRPQFAVWASATAAAMVDRDSSPRIHLRIKCIPNPIGRLSSVLHTVHIAKFYSIHRIRMSEEGAFVLLPKKWS